MWIKLKRDNFRWVQFFLTFWDQSRVTQITVKGHRINRRSVSYTRHDSIACREQLKNIHFDKTVHEKENSSPNKKSRSASETLAALTTKVRKAEHAPAAPVRTAIYHTRSPRYAPRPRCPHDYHALRRSGPGRWGWWKGTEVHLRRKKYFQGIPLSSLKQNEEKNTDI